MIPYHTVVRYDRFMKICRECGESKPESDYQKRASNKDGLMIYCKPCYNAKNRERVRAKYTPDFGRKKYALAKAKRHQNRQLAVAAQGGKCPICLRTQEEVGLFVRDHCHDSGAQRMYLCTPCNLGLGNFQDDPDRLQRARRYILDHL